MSPQRVNITIHPLGCLFWLAVIVVFVAGISGAVRL